MPRETVEVIGAIAASPEAVWAVVSDFCGRWHPAIASMHRQSDERGSLIRAFTVTGEDTLYRERLTWLSDSDRTLGYTHLGGIVGVDAYNASIAVSAGPQGGSVVRWSARVEAAQPRLQAICAGTKAIFEAGLAALGAQAAHAAAEPSAIAQGNRSKAVPPPLAPPHKGEGDLACGSSPSPLWGGARGGGLGQKAFKRSPLAIAPTEDITVAGVPDLALTASSVQGGGPLCLFLHGIGGQRRNWQPQLAAAGTVMRAAALDLRGYGDSGLGPRQSTVDDYCADILRVASALGAERLVLVGLSYGSWLATSFAMRHPQLLAGLVLSGGCTGMSEAGVQEREAFRASREAPLDAGQTPADFAPAVASILAGPNASDAVKAALFQSMAAIPAATYRDAVTCFTNPPERFDFSGLSMPVLMMTGEHDRLAPPAEIRGVAERVLAAAERPDVRYETIAAAGHVCNVEQPEAYNRVLLDFLGRLPR